MENTELTILKGELIEGGASLVGIADLSHLPHRDRHGFPRAICLAKALAPQALQDALAHEPVLSAPSLREEYGRASKVLKQLGEYAMRRLAQLGYDALPASNVPDSYDAEQLTSRLSDKRIATQAGLGWIGKSGLLINPHFGGALRLRAILTNAEFDADAPVVESTCPEKCLACTNACPAGAIKNRIWKPDLGRNELLDAHRCRETGLDYAAQGGLHHPTCGRCIITCPKTRQYMKKSRRNQD